MAALTESTDFGIEFVERFQVRRIAIAIFLLIIPSIIFGVVYGALTGDVGTAWTISGRNYCMIR